MKFMLAVDANLEKVRFPCLVQPKLDGVRFGHLIGYPTGRSLKQHKNYYVNNFFGDMLFDGFDGEMIIGSDPTIEDLCRLTSSAIGSYEGSHHFTWNIFDFVTKDSIKLPYRERLNIASSKIGQIIAQYPILAKHIKLIQFFNCVSMNDLLSYEEDFLDLGYEGLIIRDPNGLYKEGRSTVREGGLLRIKRFIEEEAIVVGVTEGQHNGNEALINELGLTYRTSHQANKIGNGMVATMQAELVKDVYDSLSKKLLFNKGQVINITAGSLTHDERKFYYENQNKIIGRISKFKFFSRGIKDKPRFPNHVSFKNLEDL